MKNINFAINGLGRIGKLLFRALFDKGLCIKLVNEINGNLEINSELLIHDSIPVSYTHLTLPTIYSV